VDGASGSVAESDIGGSREQTCQPRERQSVRAAVLLK
jgi:hypothetical protein